MSERIAMGLETKRLRDGAYDFVVDVDGSLDACIAESWNRGMSWGIWAASRDDLRRFVDAWRGAGREVRLLNGLHLVRPDGSVEDIDLDEMPEDV